eukprot:Skav227465  [mRNA]  locus=scaffold2491:315369:318542:+ [translate_table: standard]
MPVTLKEQLEASAGNLRDTSPSTRSAALETLRKNQYHYTPLVNALVSEAVGNPHEEVRVALFDLLSRDIRSTGDDNCLKLLEGLEDPVAKVRMAAFQWLGTRTTSFFWQDLGKLVTGLQDPVGEVRMAALHAIHHSLPMCPSSVKQCLEAKGLKLKQLEGLEDPAAAARFISSSLFARQMARDFRKCGRKLVRGLDDPIADVRAAAFHCLGSLSPELQVTLDTLVKGQADPDEDVRATAFQCLNKFCRHLAEDLETTDLKLELVKGLEHHVAKVRAAAFRYLQQSPSLDDLARHGLKPKLVKGLEDCDEDDVRAAAFRCLDSDMFRRHLAEDLETTDLKLKLVKGLEDHVGKVRVAACRYLRQRPSLDDLARHGLAPKLVKGLEDQVAEVRQVAFLCLSKFSRDLQGHEARQSLREHLETGDLKRNLVEGLQDPDEVVRAAASECCGNLFNLVSQHLDLIWHLAHGLKDSSEKVRRAACATLEAGLSLDVDQCIPEQIMIEGLGSLYPDVRDATCRALSTCVSPNSLARYAPAIVQAFDNQWGLWPTHAEENNLHASIRLVFKVPIEESEERDTWLHTAARCGSTQMCQALLANGLAMKSLRNARGQTASDVARIFCHDHLAELLRPSTFQTRGGSGGAIARALDSHEMVQEVSWWFIPLPGWEGRLGAVHSILKIDTDKDQYLIEGACPEKVKPEGVQRPEIERALENGLFISCWAEIKDAANVEKLPNVRPCLPSGVMLAVLVKHLLQQGPYDVGSNNCHHTAFHGYNFCAAKPLQSLPINRSLTGFARFLSRFSINLALSRSCGGPLPFLPIYAGIPRDENVTLALPRHWTGEVRDGAVDLERSSDEFVKIEAYLKENGGDKGKIPGFEIIDIKRNQNLKMLKTFRNELYDMHEQRQLRLFHSAGDAHDTVMKEGFSMAYSNLTFNAFGAGIYFAQDLRLTDYFAPSSSAGVKQVLLCCVAAGKSHLKKRIFPFVPGDRLSGKPQSEWTRELIKPEHRKAPKGYDSCIAESREALIVHREGQILWEYAIQYQTTGSAGHPYDDLRGLLKEVPQN